MSWEELRKAAESAGLKDYDEITQIVMGTDFSDEQHVVIEVVDFCAPESRRTIGLDFRPESQAKH
jgi:hypothetical protein